MDNQIKMLLPMTNVLIARKNIHKIKNSIIYIIETWVQKERQNPPRMILIDFYHNLTFLESLDQSYFVMPKGWYIKRVNRFSQAFQILIWALKEIELRKKENSSVPYIIIIISGIENLIQRRGTVFDEILYSLLKEGQNYGVILLFTTVHAPLPLISREFKSLMPIQILDCFSHRLLKKYISLKIENSAILKEPILFNILQKHFKTISVDHKNETRFLAFIKSEIRIPQMYSGLSEKLIKPVNDDELELAFQDPLYPVANMLLKMHQNITINQLRRKLFIGWVRGRRLVHRFQWEEQNYFNLNFFKKNHS